MELAHYNGALHILDPSAYGFGNALLISLHGQKPNSGSRLGQSHDFWRAYSLFVARVASFAPEREAQGRK